MLRICASVCLLLALLGWWSDVLDTDAMSSYAVTQAQNRVNVQWSVNLLRGVGCRFFIALAFFLSIGAVEFGVESLHHLDPFVGLRYRPIPTQYREILHGAHRYVLRYNTLGVEKFIYQSVNSCYHWKLDRECLVGESAVLVFVWREERTAPNVQTGHIVDEEREKNQKKGRRSPASDEETVVGGQGSSSSGLKYDRTGMAQAA